MTLIGDMKRRAKALGARAVQEVVSSERGAAAVAEAVKRVQEGRRALDEQGTRMLAAFGLATHEDLDRVSKKVGRLKKRLTALLERE